MTQNVVRCPYCVLEDEFRRMIPHLDGRFICNKCGHVAKPSEVDFNCSCRNCDKLQSRLFKRAAV